MPIKSCRAQKARFFLPKTSTQTQSPSVKVAKPKSYAEIVRAQRNIQGYGLNGGKRKKKK